ncbi:MAG: 4'-phosphopantetheinyl transferase superfamily protein [Candidatus Thermoplasmatota archaeon]|nr:4'-phosphopantetheinyl transferase superfamily protein [Candidatus Thermoplasmatota archaeon]
MWKPSGEIIELNVLDEVNIYINALKIRTSYNYDNIPEISNLEFVNLDEISNFKTAKRAEEHAAGRYLLHQMLLRYFPSIECSFVEILRDQNRAPYFNWINSTFNRITLPNFSISTSGNFAVVAICEPNYVVGVDIEKSNQIRSVNLFDFLSSDDELIEMKKLCKINGNREINMIWTIKESILKALRLGMSLSPTKIKILDKNSKVKKVVEYEGVKFNLKSQIIDLGEEYSFSIAYKKKDIQNEFKMRIAGIEPTT